MDAETIQVLVEEAREQRGRLQQLVHLAGTGRGGSLTGSPHRFEEIVVAFARLGDRIARASGSEPTAGREPGQSVGPAQGARASLLAELGECRRLVGRLEKLVTQAQAIRLSHWRPEPGMTYTSQGARGFQDAGPKLIRRLA